MPYNNLGFLQDQETLVFVASTKWIPQEYKTFLGEIPQIHAWTKHSRQAVFEEINLGVYQPQHSTLHFVDTDVKVLKFIDVTVRIAAPSY